MGFEQTCDFTRAAEYNRESPVIAANGIERARRLRTEPVVPLHPAVKPRFHNVCGALTVPAHKEPIMRRTLLSLAISAFLGLPALAQDSPAPPDSRPAADAQQTTQAAPEASDPAHNPAAAEHSEPQAEPPAEQTTAKPEQDANAHADPNYRRHNGRWWYWQNGGWLMWNGNRWVNQQERSQRVYSYAPGRSYSYMQDAAPGAEGYVPTYSGIPQSDASGLQRSTVAPGTVQYQRVIPSYGMRSAGSKVLGNY
jgi:hypothetical protein